MTPRARKAAVARAACVLLALGAPLAASAAGNPDEGRKKADTCLGCHGIPSYKNAYPTYPVPRIAGQKAEYIVAALKAYSSGERPHLTMHAQAATLSDEDMQDIAAWFEAQGGGEES